jgi:hypothetical protein
MSSHGLQIGIENLNGEILLTFKAYGVLTHEDYELITPLIDNALKGVKKESVLALFDVSEMDGWELRAAWDDFKICLKHGGQFHRIALYGDKKWQEVISKVGSWFVSGEVEYFKDKNEAMAWVLN